MKNFIIVIAISLSTVPALANVKPIRSTAGHVAVVKSWVEKNGDVFEGKSERVCEQAVRINVWEANLNDPKRDVNRDMNDMRVITCQTTDQQGRPVTVSVMGGIDTGSDRNGRPYKSLAGSYFVASEKNSIPGSWSAFMTNDADLASGQLIIPAPFPTIKTDAILKATSFNVELSFEESK